MIPDQGAVEDPDAGGDGFDSDFDTWKALQKATDEKRADLLAGIVGHPKGALSAEELDYLNPAMSEGAIRRHLKTLMDVGVVMELEVAKGERMRDFPRKFYGYGPEAPRYRRHQRAER